MLAHTAVHSGVHCTWYMVYIYIYTKVEPKRRNLCVFVWVCVCVLRVHTGKHSMPVYIRLLALSLASSLTHSLSLFVSVCRLLYPIPPIRQPPVRSSSSADSTSWGCCASVNYNLCTSRCG